MDAANSIAPRKVRDRAGDTHHAMKAARAEPHGRGGVGEQAPARFVGRGDLGQEIAVDLGIGADAVLGVAIGLAAARCGDPLRNLRGTLRRRRQDKIGRRDRGDIDMKIDPVEQRPRHLGLIIRRATRRARACQRRIAEMTAPALSRTTFINPDISPLTSRDS